MDYKLVKEVIDLFEEFDISTTKNSGYGKDLAGFKRWIYDLESANIPVKEELNWDGKITGRSAESVINTLIVHMNRYAKTYSKSAIHQSEFSTQEDFIYLINLRAFGAMTKTELIRKNIHEKPVGMQIINRLIKQNWVLQSESDGDKRSKIIQISKEGEQALDGIMGKIKQATQLVTGNLNAVEKQQLIGLLQKLDHFHQPIYALNIDPEELISIAYQRLLLTAN